MVARRSGADHIQAVVASGVRYPLLPLPATWDEVHVLCKRRFRFDSLEDFPDVSSLSSVEVGEDNYRYFFYRDMQTLGSRGKRDFHEYDEFRAP